MVKRIWRRLPHLSDKWLDTIGVGLIFVGLITLLCFVSEQGYVTQEWIWLLTRFFGWGGYLMPLLFGVTGVYLILCHRDDKAPHSVPHPTPLQIVGVIMGLYLLLVTLHMITVLLWPQVNMYDIARDGRGGGMIGAAMLDLGLQRLGRTGTLVAICLGWGVVGLLIGGVSPVGTLRSSRAIPDPAEESAPIQPHDTAPAGEKQLRTTKYILEKPELDIPAPPTAPPVWRLPTISEILDLEEHQDYDDRIETMKQARLIEETLSALDAPVRVVEISQGPAITQFGVEPGIIERDEGRRRVSIKQIKEQVADLNVALGGQYLQIQTSIPGKGLIGIEVPHAHPVTVRLRPLIESSAFTKAKGRLRLALGQKVTGDTYAVSFEHLPHLLIAGATRTGKSTCLHALLMALLLTHTPDTLRLLLVDPRRVEFTPYNGIPHLLTPTITDMARAIPALRWLMREVDGRQRRFENVGARNIQSFNQRAVEVDELTPIPYLVAAIDDVSVLTQEQLEEIHRVLLHIIERGKQEGVHLVLTTQQLTDDVIPRPLKDNFASRIALKVASEQDSRFILKRPGAEHLLGRGDMFFKPYHTQPVVRLQGAYISSNEIKRLVNYWRMQVAREVEPEAVIRARSTPQHARPVRAETDEFEDPLLPDAVEILLAENRASISLLQRRLRIGYTQSARMIESLTDLGIVTPDVRKGQSRGVNREAAEALLEDLASSGE
jgi:S-DNA-T family DNA segregation ATPase FtsK/SpoIIIE